MWATIAITDDHWLYAINFAMNQLRAYKWYDRDWQYHKDSWNNIPDGDMIQVQTSFPILKPGRFYCGNMKPVKCLNPCGCKPDEIVEDYCSPCVCACDCTSNNELEMRWVWPMDELLAWQYQIARSAWVHTDRPLGCLEDFDPTVKQETGYNLCYPCGVWWPWGNLLCMKLPTGCWCKKKCEWQGVWFTYRRSPQHTFNFNDVLLIPDFMINALVYFTAAYLMPAYRQERTGDDLGYIQLARQELDFWIMHHTKIPNKVVVWTDSVVNPGSWPWSYDYSYLT